jgi:hypothetical protein
VPINETLIKRFEGGLEMGGKKLFGLLVMGAALVGTSTMAAAGKGGGTVTGHITVPDAVYGGMTTATVNPGGDVYVYVQCYAPDFNGAYVYAAFFPADANKQAQIGPLWSTVWPQGPAQCQAQEGAFTRNGFGKWDPVATTTFNVSG